MKNNLYCLFNTLSNRYGDVIAYPSDSFALARVQPVIEQQNQLTEIELCRIGSIDIESGTIEPQNVIRIAWKETIENKPTRETNQEN